MVQYADNAGLLTNVPPIEAVLGDHASELGRAISSRIGTTFTEF